MCTCEIVNIVFIDDCCINNVNEAKWNSTIMIIIAYPNESELERFTRSGENLTITTVPLGDYV